MSYLNAEQVRAALDVARAARALEDWRRYSSLFMLPRSAGMTFATGALPRYWRRRYEWQRRMRNKRERG